MLMARRSRRTFRCVKLRDGPLPEDSLLCVRFLCDPRAFQVDNLAHYMMRGLVLHVDVSWIMSGTLHVEDRFAGQAQLPL
jgi:hypothetical protein